jgi:hypothetical protein
MRPSEIFRYFDMVVSIPEKTINKQLFQLSSTGIINNNIRIVQEFTEGTGQFQFRALDPLEQVELNNMGTPLNAFIDINVEPQLVIRNDGKMITLKLKWVDGDAWLWTGDKTKRNLKCFEVPGLEFSFDVNLELKTLDDEDINNSLKINDEAKLKIHNSNLDFYNVTGLFLNFGTSNLDIPALDSSSVAPNFQEQLKTFLAFYLKSLSKTGNPYVLSYLVTETNGKEKFKHGVPDSLKPSRIDFFLRHDSNYPEESAINFFILSKSSDPSYDPFYMINFFNPRWVSYSPPSAAKVIYGGSRFHEDVILKPLYEKLRDSIYEDLKEALTLEGKREYTVANMPVEHFYEYELSKQNLNDSDRYDNTYHVSLSYDQRGIRYLISGSIFIYKGLTRNLGVCTARFSFSRQIDWEATIDINPNNTESGLQFIPHIDFKINAKGNKDENQCAQMLDIKDLSQLISESFESVSNNLPIYFSDFFETGFAENVSFKDALSNTINGINNFIILPAGQQPSLMDMRTHEYGDVVTSLSYEDPL